MITFEKHVQEISRLIYDLLSRLSNVESDETIYDIRNDYWKYRFLHKAGAWFHWYVTWEDFCEYYSQVLELQKKVIKRKIKHFFCAAIAKACKLKFYFWLLGDGKKYLRSLMCHIYLFWSMIILFNLAFRWNRLVFL